MAEKDVDVDYHLEHVLPNSVGSVAYPTLCVSLGPGRGQSLAKMVIQCIEDRMTHLEAPLFDIWMRQAQKNFRKVYPVCS